MCLKILTSLLAFISGAVWHEVSSPSATRNGRKLQLRTFYNYNLQIILKSLFSNRVGKCVRNDTDARN